MAFLFKFFSISGPRADELSTGIYGNKEQGKNYHSKFHDLQGKGDSHVGNVVEMYYFY